MLTPIGKSNKSYIKIIGGNFVQQVEEGTPNAKMREAKNPKTGEVKIVWEVPYKDWTGVINNISFEEKEFGRLCLIESGDLTISLLVGNKYFSSFAESIVNCDLSKPVKLHPYDMGQNDKGKKVTGISVQQNGNKIPSAYWTEDGKRVDGFPKVDENMKDKKGYWAMYFAGVDDFLCEQVSKLTFGTTPKEVTDEEVDIDDLPF